VLLRNLDSDATTESNKFIMKPIGVDDRARNAMMTLLPFSSPAETTSYIRGLNISPSNPFQLQQFIRGSEYCTHALVIHGQVKAFTSCPSLELLMHYEPLPAYSALSQEMLAFTERVVAAGGADFTGHLSFDFLVEKSSTDDLKFYPIECNPRAHTAVVLFDQTPELAAAYLSIFDDTTSEAERSKSTVVFPRTPTHSYYWAGHDLVTYLVLPVLDFLTGHASIHDVSAGVTTLWSHLSNWKDGTLTLADPWPFFVLYHVYWPAKFAQALMRGRPWSRINVSTTKMFE
jgi:catechol O-methyltransferase